MRCQNTYYKDLIDGKVLRPLVVTKIKKGGFIKYMKSIGKLGANKVPRLANNRDIANKLSAFLMENRKSIFYTWVNGFYWNTGIRGDF